MSKCDCVKNLFSYILNNFGRKTIIHSELETIKVINYDINELMNIIFQK